MDPNTIEVHGLDIIEEQTKQSPSLIEIFLVARIVDVLSWEEGVERVFESSP